MDKAKIFLRLALGFIGGIFGVSFCYPRRVDSLYFFTILVFSLISLFVFYKNKKVYVAVFTLFFFLSGSWLTSARLERMSALDAAGRNFSGEVLVIKEPEIKNRMQKITVEDGSGDMKLLVAANAYAAYGYGDRLKLDCVLEIPENKDGFDYRMYLAKDSIFYLCKSPKIELLESGRGNRAYGAILKIKKELQEKIAALLPAPQSGLLTGLILGGDDELSENVQTDFSRTGLTHIVAVSGYNVTIVAEYLMLLGIFLGLWRKQAFWFALGGIFLFVVLTGFPASAVRAGVMGSLILWAMKNGRLANAQNSILFAAAAMLLWNPLLLRWDVGFQLSFLATLGIVYFYPLIEKYSIKKQGISFFNEILFLTLSAQIFVLPILLNDFQQLSVIAPLANLLVLPVIPLAMLLGFLMVVCAFIFPPLATILAWLVFLPLKYVTMAVGFMSGLKSASVEVLDFSWGWVVGWYMLLAGLVFFSKRTRQTRNDPDFLMESVSEKNKEAPF
ncbi:MAG: ComEC/Rec2 family competence protein [Candidatus Moranbacteria bacterium]|nr:ComEC/Rec2 family competence protein [Candidatus Moranbacteria bacterium]